MKDMNTNKHLWKRGFLEEKPNSFLNCMFGCAAAAAPMAMLRILAPIRVYKQSMQVNK